VTIPPAAAIADTEANMTSQALGTFDLIVEAPRRGRPADDPDRCAGSKILADLKIDLCCRRQERRAAGRYR